MNDEITVNKRSYDLLVSERNALREQLLSALAAIEKHNKKCGHVLGDHVWLIDAIDLSLLHEHDAEVRKPLAEALRGQRIYGEWGTAIVVNGEQIDALVKQ